MPPDPSTWQVPPPPPSTPSVLSYAPSSAQLAPGTNPFSDLIPDKNSSDQAARVPSGADSSNPFSDLIPDKPQEKAAKQPEKVAIVPAASVKLQQPPAPVAVKTAPVVPVKTTPLVHPAGQPAPKLVAPPPPVPVEDFGKTLSKAGQQALDTVIKGGQGLYKDYKHNPAKAALATIASLPVGPMKLGEDIGSIINQARGEKQSPDQDTAAKEYLKMLPPEVRKIVEQNPGASGLGELAGSSAIPLPGMASAGSKAAQIAKGVLKGAAVGEGFGTLGAAGERARENKGINPKESLKAGLPSAIIGGTLGAAHGVLSKAKETPAPEKTEAELHAEQLQSPYEHVTMGNGEKLSKVQIAKIMDNPEVPDHVKEEIAAKDEELSLHKLAQTAPPQHQIEAKPAPREHDLENDSPAKVHEDAIHNIKLADNLEDLQKVTSDAHRAIGKVAAGPVSKDLQKMLDAAYQTKKDAIVLRDSANQPSSIKNPKAPSRDDIRWYLEEAQKQEEERAKKVAADAKDKPLAALARPQPPLAPQQVAPPIRPGMTQAQAPPPPSPEAVSTVAPEAARPVQAPIQEASKPLPTPEAKTPEAQAPEAKPAANEGAKLRFIAEPDTARAGGYHRIRDLETGDVVSSSKRSLAEAQRVADGYNAGKKTTQGQGSSRSTMSSVANESEAFTHGQPVPAHLEPLANELADITHQHHEAQAKLDAMSEAFQKKYGMTPETGLRRGQLAPNEDEEQAAFDKGYANRLEVTPSKKVKASFSFNKEVTPEQQAKDAKAVLEQNKLAGQIEKTYKSAKDKFDKAWHEGESAPRTMNVEHPKGAINARYVPTERDYTQAPQETYVKRKINEIKALAKHFAASESGAGQAGFGADLITAGGASRLAKKLGIDPFDAALAEGEAKIPGWKNNLEKVTKWASLKRTLDFVNEVNPELHGNIWRNIARETLNARGVKFNPDDDALVQQSLSMDPKAIRMGKDGLNSLTYEQRNYLAERRALRQESAGLVRGQLEKMEEKYGETKNMPEVDKTRYEVMSQLENALRGRSKAGDTSEVSTLGDVLTGAMYDYVFKWNPAYHGLNLTDPLAIGGARAGLGRVMKAKYMLQADKTVKDYIDGFETKSPINQLRSETRAALGKTPPKGVSDDWSYKSMRAITKLQSMLPDLPSEHWNVQDMLTAGFIKYGDESGYKGGGMKFLHDLAAGKIGEEETVKAMIESLQVTNDVTGAGGLGLDKSIIQRVPAMKYVTQFVSQNYRVARLIQQFAKSGDAKAIATLLGMHALIGGHAAIPQEAQELAKLRPESAKLLYLTSNFLDNYTNGVSHIPVIGRDLADKMKYSVLVPALGGAQANLAYQQLHDLFSQLEGRKLDKLGKASVWLAMSSILGGGGLEAARIDRTTEAALKGQKKYAVYADAAMPGIGDHPIASHVRKPYGAVEALIDHLPGKNPEEARNARADQQKNVLKKLR